MPAGMTRSEVEVISTKLGKRTTHVQSAREEVASVRDQRDQAGLDAGVEVQARVLQDEGAAQAEGDAQCHGRAEGEQEYADSVKDRRHIDIRAVELGQCSIEDRHEVNDVPEIMGREDRSITHSYMTILTASFNKLSPKMTEYSLGSTLY